jgi:hypothetical protein
MLLGRKVGTSYFFIRTIVRRFLSSVRLCSSSLSLDSSSVASSSWLTFAPPLWPHPTASPHHLTTICRWSHPSLQPFTHGGCRSSPATAILDNWKTLTSTLWRRRCRPALIRLAPPRPQPPDQTAPQSQLDSDSDTIIRSSWGRRRTVGPGCGATSRMVHAE